MHNKNNEKFSISKRLKSFKYAINGLEILFKEEHNARIHFVITIFVIISGLFFDISLIEWMVIALCISIVFATEIINSSIENICDLISPQKNDFIKKIKDLSAAAVLVTAIISLICGLIIFIPKIIALI